VLDTNAVSALMKGDVAVTSKARSLGMRDIAIPQPVIAELAYGIERLPRSKRRSILEDRLNQVSAVLPRTAWTDSVSEHFGKIKAALEQKGQRLEDFDLAIAAHALALGAALVTADREPMARIPGLKVEDWSRP
jgi:tRNA(fMet)-specific endonuclease VapC